MRREVREITDASTWHEWRRVDVTASRVAALFDAHPYLTRDQLAAQLRGEAAPSDSAAMRAGRILEPGVAVALGEDNPDWRIRKATTYHRIPELRLGATPDYWLDDDALIQAKTVSPEVWQKWHGKPSLSHTLQTLCEMICADKARGMLAVMVRASPYPLYVFDVPRHEAAERRLLDAVRVWWEEWDAGVMDAPAADPAGLAEMLDDGQSIDLSSNDLLCQQLPVLIGLKNKVAAAKKEINEIESSVKAAMGRASFGYLPGFSISYRTQKRNETVIPAANIRVLRVKSDD